MVSMIFMQLSASTSIRDIANGLMSAMGNLSHLGITKAPSKSSMSYINKHRSYEVFRDIYFELLESLEPSLEKNQGSMPEVLSGRYICWTLRSYRSVYPF